MKRINIKSSYLNIYKDKTLDIIKQNKLFWVFLIIFILKSIIFTTMIQASGAAGFEFFLLGNSLVKGFLYMLFSMMMLSFSFVAKGARQWKVMIVLDMVLTVIIISDVFYYRGFSSYMNFFLLDQLSMTEDLGGSVIALFRPIDFLFILDFIFLSWIIKKFKDAYKNKIRSFKSFYLILTFSFVFLAVYYLDFNFGYESKITLVENKLEYYHMPEEKMVMLGPIGYHIYDGFNYFNNKKPFTLSEEDEKSVEEFYDEKEENLRDNEYKSYFKNKNLLLIQVESLENFVINREVQGQTITPNINKLLSNSVYFDNYYEQVWNGNSSDCDLLVNSSVYPVREGATFYRYPNNYYPHSLPNIMKTLDYNTFVVHPDMAMYWNYKPALSAMGFEELYFAEELKVEEKIGLGISDKEYFQKTLEIIKKQEQPFYGVTVTITSHTPFDLPKEYQYLNLKEDINKSEIGKYFQAIHYTDKQIGNFIDNLDKEGILDNTVIVLYGDHTGVHKYFQDKIDMMKNKEEWWSNNDNKIPLLIYNKNSPQRTISTYGGPVDLVPTLGYLMGVDNKHYNTAMGRNLLNTNKDFVILSNFQVRGNLTEEEKNKFKTYLILSDKLIRSNYFYKKQ